MQCTLCFGLPLCWKVFSENTTPHQQCWAKSIQKSPSIHLVDYSGTAVGINHRFTQNTDESCSCRGENSNDGKASTFICGTRWRRFTSTALSYNDDAEYSLVKAFPLLALNIALVYLVLLRFFYDSVSWQWLASLELECSMYVGWVCTYLQVFQNGCCTSFDSQLTFELQPFFIIISTSWSLRVRVLIAWPCGL